MEDSTTKYNEFFCEINMREDCYKQACKCMKGLEEQKVLEVSGRGGKGEECKGK